MSDEARNDGASARALTVRDVAAEYGVAIDTVYRWIKSGRLRPLRLPSGNYRFRREHLTAFDDECRNQLPGEPPRAAPVPISNFRQDAFEVGRRMSAKR
jgi:excisionase family DNA binding protein